MDGDNKSRRANAQLVTKIIASYVSNHNVGPEQIPELIGAVHQTFERLGKPEKPQGTLTPAVPVRRSVQRDHVVCLDCGWKGKMLRRHLSTRHGYTSEEYLRRWGLPNDHPLTAPIYSEQRSSLARELGLGRGSRPADIPEPSGEPAPPAPPRRRLRAGASR
ncbi:MAG: MucR family transcriptional regulator [Alphaproteobacteria bacterium]|nr:MucR family transcriptional regulator [Alphaproteobacteria bacterium]